MTPQTIQMIGFSVAGAALLIVASFAPRLAIALALIIGLGVLLLRANQVSSLFGLFNNSLSGGLKP